MRRTRNTLFAALALSMTLSASGCGGGAAQTEPTAAELVGLWANEDAGTIRVMEFKDGGRYTIYNYATGQQPNAVQAGTFEVRDRALITQDEATGKKYSNAIHAFDGQELVLQSTTSATGDRTFRRVTAMP